MVRVTLRRKPISKGRLSLYLDFYPAIPDPKNPGKYTRREFLNIYLHEKPADVFEKEANKNREHIAKQKRINRENEVNKLEVYSDFERERLEMKRLGERDFFEYFSKHLKDNSYKSTLSKLQSFAPKGLKFADLSEKLCNEFKAFLLDPKTSLAKNTAKIYFDRFKTILKAAYKEGYLLSDLSTKIQGLGTEETARQYLTLEEVQLLVNTPCSNEAFKRMALFSVLTGMRWSDIVKLQWKEVHNTSEGYSIHFRQKKTKGVEELPITDEAYLLLGSMENENGNVFETIPKTTAVDILKRWVNAAGLTKHITFHSFRHTFAFLQLSEGVDIYRVSKLLGHRELSTTQIYAKVDTKSKREAVNKIKLKL